MATATDHFTHYLSHSVDTGFVGALISMESYMAETQYENYLICRMKC